VSLVQRDLAFSQIRRNKHRPDSIFRSVFVSRSETFPEEALKAKTKNTLKAKYNKSLKAKKYKTI